MNQNFSHTGSTAPIPLLEVDDKFTLKTDEMDTNENGADRITPAGSVWKVIGREPDSDPVMQYSVLCESTGGLIHLTHDELSKCGYSRVTAPPERIVHPQHMTLTEFIQWPAVITPLVNHGRAAEVFLNGKSMGFVDALGDDGLRQAHRRSVNNALWANSPDALGTLESPLPSAAALADYPDLRAKFPCSAKLVDEATTLRQNRIKTAEAILDKYALSDKFDPRNVSHGAWSKADPHHLQCAIKTHYWVGNDLCETELDFHVKFDSSGAIVEANAYDRRGAVAGSRGDIDQTVSTGHSPTTSFSVRFAYLETGSLEQHLRDIDAGELSLVTDRLAEALVNPSKVSSKAGYDLKDYSVAHVAGDIYRLDVIAIILDPMLLENEACAEYERCWGNRPAGNLTAEEQLYEVLVASNANPSLADIGITLIDWQKNDVIGLAKKADAPQAEAKAKADALLQQAGLPSYSALLYCIDLMGTTSDRLSETETGFKAMGRDISLVSRDMAMVARGTLDAAGYVRESWLLDRTHPVAPTPD